MNVRGSTTSVFDHLGQVGTNQRRGRDCLIDKPVDEVDDQNKLDHLQRQLDLEQVGAVGPPFTLEIMAMP